MSKRSLVGNFQLTKDYPGEALNCYYLHTLAQSDRSWYVNDMCIDKHELDSLKACILYYAALADLKLIMKTRMLSVLI